MKDSDDSLARLEREYAELNELTKSVRERKVEAIKRTDLDKAADLLEEEIAVRKKAESVYLQLSNLRDKMRSKDKLHEYATLDLTSEVTSNPPEIHATSTETDIEELKASILELASLHTKVCELESRLAKLEQRRRPRKCS